MGSLGPVNNMGVTQGESDRDKIGFYSSFLGFTDRMMKTLLLLLMMIMMVIIRTTMILLLIMVILMTVLIK